MCGRVAMGGGAPVSIQSMTNTDTRDAAATLAQVRALAAAGCDIVRISVYDEACARAMREIRDGSPTPLVADVHFDYRLAVLAVENGADKLRINPGNIGGERRVQKVADCARAHGVPIRVGVNSGSVEKELLRRYDTVHTLRCAFAGEVTPPPLPAGCVLRRDGDAIEVDYPPARVPTGDMLDWVRRAGTLREMTLKEQNVDQLIARMYQELAL